MMAADVNIEVLAEKVRVLEQKADQMHESLARFVERQDEISDKIFEKMDSIAKAQSDSIASLKSSLEPVQLWAAQMQGALSAIIKIGAILAAAAGAIWGVFRFMWHITEVPK